MPAASANHRPAVRRAGQHEGRRVQTVALDDGRKQQAGQQGGVKSKRRLSRISLQRARHREASVEDGFRFRLRPNAERVERFLVRAAAQEGRPRVGVLGKRLQTVRVAVRPVGRYAVERRMTRARRERRQLGGCAAHRGIRIGVPALPQKAHAGKGVVHASAAHVFSGKRRFEVILKWGCAFAHVMQQTGQLAYAAQRLRQAGRRDIRRAAAVGFDRLPLGAAVCGFSDVCAKQKTSPLSS